MSSSALPGTPRTPASRKTGSSGRLEELPRTGSSGSPRGGGGTPTGGSRASSLRQGSLGLADNGPAVSPEIQAQLAAQAAERVSKAALEEIERDPIFSSFLGDEFNATSFASQVSLAHSKFHLIFTPPARVSGRIPELALSTLPHPTPLNAIPGPQQRFCRSIRAKAERRHCIA